MYNEYVSVFGLFKVANRDKNVRKLTRSGLKSIVLLLVKIEQYTCSKLEQVYMYLLVEAFHGFKCKNLHFQNWNKIETIMKKLIRLFKQKYVKSF